MTRIGKILVILITFASLAFAGFAIVATYGGPNWQEMASQIDGYKFRYTGGENPVWTAVRARGEEQVASDRNLPKVIDAVLADKISKLNAEKTSYQNRIPPVAEALATTQANNQADLPAIRDYIVQERARIEALNAVRADLEKKVLAQTAAAQKLGNIASARREDVFRLTGELAEIRADQVRVGAVRRHLAEELEQVNGNIERAVQRQDSLPKP